MKVRLERHGSSFLCTESWVYVIGLRPVKFPFKRFAPEGETKLPLKAFHLYLFYDAERTVLMASVLWSQLIVCNACKMWLCLHLAMYTLTSRMTQTLPHLFTLKFAIVCWQVVADFDWKNTNNNKKPCNDKYHYFVLILGLKLNYVYILIILLVSWSKYAAKDCESFFLGACSLWFPMEECWVSISKSLNINKERGFNLLSMKNVKI